MARIVMKFGGTSMAGIERIRAVAERVKREAEAGNQVAVLDPFEIGQRNLDILRQELHALDRPRLLNIIAGFELNPAGTDVTPLSDEQPATFIVVAVGAQMTQRAR